MSALRCRREKDEVDPPSQRPLMSLRLRLAICTVPPLAVKSQLDDATWQKMFVDVTPEDLASKGKPFPIAPYFNDILESYEKKVAN